MRIMEKRFFIGLLILCVMMVSFVGCSSNNNPTPSEDDITQVDLSVYENGNYFITPQEVQAMLGSEDLVLLDCNKPDLYGKEHLPGAISIGLHAFSDKVGKPGDTGWGTIKSKEDLTKVLMELGIDNDKTVVLYSNVFKGPGADGRAAWQLTLAGMDNVQILLGGLSYWKDLGYEVTKEMPSEIVPTTEVVLKDYDQSFIATKELIHENLGQQFVLDVRTEKEYNGSQNAGEPRGGHIQGAKHFLWTDFLEADGTLKSPEDIEKINEIIRCC